MAAADLLGSTAGEMVNSVSNEDAERWLVVGLLEVLMDVMAWELDVKERACVMSCLSFAYEEPLSTKYCAIYKKSLPRRHTS